MEGGSSVTEQMPRKEQSCYEKCTAMNTLYTLMLVVLFTTALLGLICVVIDPNHEEKDKMIKIIIMVINIIFLLWWFSEFCRNIYKQFKYLWIDHSREP